MRLCWLQLRERLNVRLGLALAWHLPHWLVYWAVIRVWAYATQGKYGDTDVTRLTLVDALERWEKA